MDITITRVRGLSRYWLVIAGVAIYVGLLSAVFPRWTVDDAYITFRYAENLAHHGELTWNVGHDPVEGYTGVLWPLLLAGGVALGADPVAVSQGLGAAGLLASWWFVAQLLIDLKASRRAQLVGIVLFGTAGFLWRHAYGGLETMLFTALVLWAFLAHLHRRREFLALLLLAVSLTRPEGVLLASVLGGIGAWERRRNPDELSAYLSTFWMLYILPGGLYFKWRMDYYGYLLPNTFYVKGAGAWEPGASWGSLGAMIFIYLLLPALAGLLTGSARQAVAGRRRFFVPLALFALPLLAFYLRSSLVMNFAYRFFVPLVPLALIALALLLDTNRRWWKVVAGVLGLQVMLQAGIWAFAESIGAATYQQLLADEHKPAAAYIRQHLPADEVLIAYVDAGVVGYETGRSVVDFGGLNDEFLAHLWAGQGDPREAIEYFYGQHAGAVLWTPEAASWPGPYGAALAPRIQLDPRWQQYQLVAQWDSPQWTEHYGETYRQQLYMRRDLIGGER